MRKEKGRLLLRLEEKVHSSRGGNIPANERKVCKCRWQIARVCPVLEPTDSFYFSVFAEMPVPYVTICVSKFPVLSRARNGRRGVLSFGTLFGTFVRKSYSNLSVTLTVRPSVHPSPEFDNLRISERIFAKNCIVEFP